MTPFGIFLPGQDDLWLYMARSKVTSDFIVDRLEQWWQEVRLQYLGVKVLVINLDNGPENHSRRTQFLKRVVEFARKYGLKVQLAYFGCRNSVESVQWTSPRITSAGLTVIRYARTRQGTCSPATNDAGPGCRTPR